MKNARFITNKAKQLLKQFGEQTAPVDVEGICKKLGILLLEKELKDNVAGLLLFKGTQPYIVINSNGQTIEKKRYTIAHELGHFLFHKNQHVHVLNNDLVAAIKSKKEKNNGRTRKENQKFRGAN